jgi:hypothetical protein
MAGAASVTATIDAADKSLDGVIELLLRWSPPEASAPPSEMDSNPRCTTKLCFRVHEPMSARWSSGRIQRFEPAFDSGDYAMGLCFVKMCREAASPNSQACDLISSCD